MRLPYYKDRENFYDDGIGVAQPWPNLDLFDYDKEKMAIDRICTFEPPDGYYVAFSGGKDSCVILELAKRAGVKFDAHYSLTTVDPPELVMFIRDTHPEVKIEHPEYTMWELIKKHKMLPTRNARFCCGELKERGGDGRTVITGVRKAESSRRAYNRKMLETCEKHGRKRFLNPIIDWYDTDVWCYIKENNISYCKLYDEGWKRIGCILCPFASEKEIKKEVTRWPKVIKKYKMVFQQLLDMGKYTDLGSVDAIFDWYTHRGHTKSDDECQMDIFNSGME